MSAILRSDSNNSTWNPGKMHPVFVNDIRYTNSAAKFWVGLIKETIHDFPGCTAIELSSSAADSLTGDLLFPELSLERDLERYLAADIQAEMTKTLAELEIIGPPSAVHIRLLSGEAETTSHDMPADIIDSEIFSCLIVWPLKWAGIPECRWNENILEGKVCLEERKSGHACSMSFDLKKHHLSEGLFRRVFRISSFARTHSGTEKTAAP